MSKGHFILYNSNEKNFTSMGVLVLDNYIMNTIIKETMNENYTFEFEMFNSVAHLVGPRMYIKAPTRKGEELFRVRIIEKDMNNYGATYFYCTQVFFCDMEDNFIENLELLNVTGYAALNSMDTSTQYPHKFTFYSDISEANSTIILRKNFVSALIGDSEYSFVNTWGGELEVNKFSVKMMSKIGQDRGVRIHYRKNLTGLNAKTDYSSYCTRIMPLGYDDITIPEKYVDSEKMDPNHPIIRVVEFSNIKVKTNEEDEEGYATIEEAENALRETARKLFTEGKLDEPESTYEIEFQELSSTIEYHDDYAVLENIFLGDTVEVYHEDLDVSVSTRCVSYEYDPKTDRYISITLGNIIGKFSSSSIKNQETIIDKIESNEKDYQGKLDAAVEKLTNMINTGLTGHVVITDNEIMIMDTTDKDTAVEVWRYNINGFGYSNTGYNGPFIGLTKDGKLLVTEATTNKFTAALINAGILQSVDGSSWFNLDNGTFSWANGAIVYDGSELNIKVGDSSLNDILDSSFNIIVNHEHQVIQLDSNHFPITSASYEFTFTVLKDNTTVETPCIINKITPKGTISGITYSYTNNTCVMSVDGNVQFANNIESYFDVELQVLDYTLTKRISWSTTLNGKDGAPGKGASYARISASSQVFIRPEDSDIYNPTSIKLSATFVNASYSKWQYSIDAGNTWVNVTSGSNGLTINSSTKVLTIANTCSLFTDAVKTLTFKLVGTNGTSDTATVMRIDNGQNGRGIDTVVNYYLVSSKKTGITTTTSGWSTSIPTMTSTNKYLWNYEVTTYTDNNTSTSDPVIIGVYGDKGDTGDTGADGKGIESIVEYYLVSSKKTGVTTTTSGWSTTIPTITSTSKYLWNYEVITYNDASNTTTDPKIIGAYGDKGSTGAAGNDAVNVILGNENHSFSASSSGKAVAASVSTSVLGYAGVTQKECTVGTITNLPTGMTATIANNGTLTTTVTFTVTTSMTTKNGTVTVPVTCEGITIEKLFSYSLAVEGTKANTCKIMASTNVFKSNDGGVTFSPSTITLTCKVQTVTFSKWQYSLDGGSTWKDVVSGSNGLTISSNVLTIAQTSSLYNTTVTSITFKAVSSNSSVYDTIAIYKLYDRTSINDDLEKMELTVSQSNSKWEAAFRSSNANNLFLNSDAQTGTSENWVDNGGGLSVGKANAYPFYGSTECYFKTSGTDGYRYGQDLKLEPNTDYMFEAYIYKNLSTSGDGSESEPLNIWTWTGTTPTEGHNASTIIDYRQTLTAKRFVKCYVHFKTNDLTTPIYGRFFIKGFGGNIWLGVKRKSLKKGTVETSWTQHPNEVKSTLVSMDGVRGLTVHHSEANTYTQMDATGFSLRDSETDDVFAWLSRKEQWTELKVDKVFASNIENVYEGDSNLYVDHSATVAGNGTADKPFNSFQLLAEHLEATPVINKDIFITVRDPGVEINEQLHLTRLKGTGFIKITLEGKLVIRGRGEGQPCIRLTQIPKWVWIVSGRDFGSSTTGAVLCDAGKGHGIIAADVDRLEVDALTISCANWGIKVERTHLYTWHVDFGKTYNAVELQYMSIYYSSDDVGSCTDFVRLRSGSFAYWGPGTVRPQGNVQATNGVFYSSSNNLVPTASPRYSSSNPSVPTGQQVYTYNYDWTSHKTYAYSWSNWSDNDCKQGSWGYGLRGGHMFFDLSTIRSQMTGTVQDGNTITLTRANTGGISGGANVYINGSTCSSASGTPSYGGQTLLGTLAWGETKSFTLPKAIVQGLISGSYNSLAVYVNNTASNCYLNIVNAKITLKTKK